MSRNVDKKDEPLRYTESDTRKLDDSRKRVVRAFLALRAVKTIGADTEPALRLVREQLLQMPNRMAGVLEHEDAAMIAKMLRIEVWRIIADFERLLAAVDDLPRTPINARYVHENNQLLQGDLSLK